MKTKSNFKRGGSAFSAALLSLTLLLLCGNLAFAGTHWKGVPFVLDNPENEWGRYYDDGTKSTSDYRYLFYDIRANYFMGMTNTPSLAMTHTMTVDENCVWYANNVLYDGAVSDNEDSYLVNIWREFNGENRYYFGSGTTENMVDEANRPTTFNRFYLKSSKLAKYNGGGYYVSWYSRNNQNKWLSRSTGTTGSSADYYPSSSYSNTNNIVAFRLDGNEQTAYVFKDDQTGYYMTYEGDGSDGSAVTFAEVAPVVHFDADAFVWNTKLNSLNNVIPTAIYKNIGGVDKYLIGWAGAGYSHDAPYHIHSNFVVAGKFYENNSHKLYRCRGYVGNYTNPETSFYTQFENGEWNHENNSNRTSAIPVTITTDVEYLAETPVIHGAPSYSGIGSSDYSISDIKYYVNATNYEFESTDHFGGGALATGLTYSWEVSSNIASYVTLTNGTTATPTLNYNTLASEIVRGTLTCTVSYMGNVIATATKNITLADSEASLALTFNDLLNHGLSLYNSSTAGYLEPCDVSVTYYGYGKYNSTIYPGQLDSSTELTELATSDGVVAVGHADTEFEHTLIYKKTLEKSPSDANWSYITIANPFYQRPKIGDDYYGFAAWRVKSGSNISGYSVGDIIPANTRLAITGEGDIELEAVWVKANVVTSSGSLSNNYTYETQFFVYTSNQTITGFYNYPCTYTSIYPDGSNYSASNIHDLKYSENIDLEDDSKFEYINIGTYDKKIHGNGHNIRIGRGVGVPENDGLPYYVAYEIAGYYYTSNNSNNISFNYIIESGVFNNSQTLEASASRQLSGNGDIQVVYGSDYDRANGDNSRLTINGSLYHAYNAGFNTTASLCDYKFLSGTFETQIGGTERFCYLGSWNIIANPGDTPTVTSTEKRNVEILGGVYVGSVSGGVQTGADTRNVLDIRVKGGTFNRFYGSAQFVDTYGNRRIIITGGTFNRWIAGGCNGTSAYGGVTYGNSYIYIGGNANQTSDEGLFGAGYGTAEVYGGSYANSYTVYGSTIVVADNAQISGSVYGGGNNGYAVNGSTIDILGGTIGGSVFGGANKNSGGGSNVTVNGGSISGSVYGGSNTKGTLTAATNVTINGGSIGGKVFGAGYGANTGVNANTYVNINSNVPSNVYGGGEYGSCGGTEVNINSGANVGGDVYGGGENGVSAATIVNVNGGTVNGNVFAGALGRDKFLVVGNKTLNMNGGSVGGSVYGGSRNANDGYTTEDVFLGTGNGHSNIMPFYNTYYNSYGEFIYTASELSSVGVITSLAFYCLTPNKQQGYTSLKIYLGHRSTTHSSTTDWTSPDDLTLVYSGSSGGHIGGVDGWETYNFSTPFVYNRTDNIVVVIAKNGNANNNDLSYKITSESSLPSGLALYKSGSYVYPGTNAGTLSGDNNRPNIKFGSPSESVSSFVNIAGGTVTNNVYGGGYYGHITGNTFVNIGKNAIENSPCAASNTNKPATVTAGNINIGGSVYSGSDWGEMSGSGFGPSNISGHTDIYIDGTGHSSINAGTALYGAGTSSFAGEAGSNIYVRNYGTSGAKSFTTIQHASDLVIDNSNINLTGAGDQEQSNVSEPYAVRYVANEMRLVNGSTISINAPIQQVANLGSYTCADIYAGAPTYTATDYSTPGNTINMTPGETGHYINVVDTTAAATYGAVTGYFRFGGTLESGTSFAYARQKQAVASPCYDSSYEHPDDGGFVSTNSSYNSYNASGAESGELVQICYINHPQGSKDPNYYREWVLKTATMGSEVEGTLIAAVDRSSAEPLLTTSTTMMIPSAEGNYFVLTDIDFGDDAGLVETGKYYNSASGTTSTTYAYRSGSTFAYDGTVGTGGTAAVNSAIALMNADVNTRFGLTMTPKSGYGSVDLTTWIINADALEKYHSGTKITLPSNTDEVLTVDFTLTYSNSIDMNAELSPVTVTLTEYNNSNEVVNKVHVKLNIITKTSVLQDTELDVYITQNGRGDAVETSSVNLLLPTFVMTDPDQGTCHFTVTNIATSGMVGTFDASICPGNIAGAGLNKVAIQYGAVPNSDQTNHWTGTEYTGSASYQNCSFSTSQVLGGEDGRFASSIGFVVSYDGTAESNTDEKIGTVTYTIVLDNYEENSDNNFTVTLNIYRRSKVQNWYLSHKGNSFNSGKFPDEPKRSMYNVFNSGYATGDKVFIVDTVRVSSQQEWDGLSYGGINVYRYTGSHIKSNGTADVAVAYTGTLIHVLDGGNLQMSGVTIDGMATGSPSYDVTGINLNTSYTAENGVPSVGPAILVNADSRIEFFDGTIAYNNNTLNHNVETVGGVQMLGSMTIGGDVQINNNMAHGIEGNVYLPSYDKYLVINAEGLDANAFIGITKLDFDGNAFTPIANSSAANAQAAYTNDNFFADNGIGQLYYDNVDNATNNTQKEKVYFSMTWVAHVQSAPGGFSAANINSPEALAWAISYVNGYNGQEAHPGTNITITADLNMNDFIWVPIGDRYSPYAGTFTGNAKVIDSIHSGINHIGAKGLFGYTNGATINGAFVKSGELEMTDVNAYVGGIVGNANETTIDFCQSGLEATANSGYAGGIVGRMENSTVVNSMAVGDVSGNIAGGVAGYTTASSEVVSHSAIENTFVNANVEGLAYTGGIAGYNQIDLTNNYVHANTTITGDNAGVLVGHNVMSLASAVDADTTVNSGNGTTNNEHAPFWGAYANYSLHTQFIQPAMTDIPSGSFITQLVFYYKHTQYENTNTISNMTVKIMPVDYTTFSNTTFKNVSTAVTVYTGSVSLNTTDQTMTITFDTPYEYSDNTVNLLIDFSKPAGGLTNRIFFYGNNPSSTCLYEYHNAFGKAVGSFLPKMKVVYESGSDGSAKTGITKCYYTQGTTLPLTKTNDGADTDVISNCNYFTSTAAYDYANQGGNRVGATTTRLAAQMNTETTGYLPWTYTTASDINGDMPVLSNTDFTCMGQADGTRFIDYGTDVNNLIALYNTNDGGGAINLTANADITSLPDSDVTLYINEDVAVTQSISGNINAYTGITMKNEGTLGTKNRTWHFFSSPLTAAPMGLTYENEGTTYNPYGSTPEDGETVYPYLGNVNPAVNGYIPNDMGYTAEGGSVTSNGTYMDFDLYSYCEPDYHWINLKRNSNSHFHEDEPHAQITYTNETTFTPGKGYMFALGDNSSHSQVFVQSNGVLNNSNSISLPISRSGAHLTGYNFLGNPYQSYLDFQAFADDDNNRGIWSSNDHKGYVIYDAVLGGYVSFGYDLDDIYPSQGAIAAGQYINMHQGFMVISDGSATQAVFKNSMRDITPNATHFRGEQPTFPVVNLIATDANGKKDFTVVEVNRPSNGGVRKLTGIRNGNAMMYAHYDNANLGLAFIEGTPEYVPLWFEAQEDGIYTLTWNTANFDLGYMHLVDNLTGADYDMLSNDQYTFQSNRTDSKARFRLVFKPMGIEEEVESETGENFAFIDNNGQLIVNGEGELSFIDLNGRILMTEYVSGQQNHISMPKVAVGMYMLRLSSVNGTKVQKIVVRK